MHKLASTFLFSTTWRASCKTQHQVDLTRARTPHRPVLCSFQTPQSPNPKPRRETEKEHIMKSAVLNTATQSLLIALVLPCFVLSPKAQAVIPAPDGGYPGANTAEGQNALLSLTTGTYNTAVGLFSLRN